MRASSWASATFAFVTLITASFATLEGAHAQQGILYSYADTVVLGEPSVVGVDPSVPVDPAILDKLDPSPRWYYVPMSLLSSLHVGFGGTFAGGERGQRRMILDVTEGVRFGRSLHGDPRLPGLILMPRIGYTFEPRGGGMNLGRLGLGVGYGNSQATLMFAPHYVFGRDETTQWHGLRTSAVLSLASDLFAVELSHQVLASGEGVLQDVRGTASVNFLVLAYVLMQVAR